MLKAALHASRMLGLVDVAMETFACASIRITLAMAAPTTFNDVRQMLRRWDKVQAFRSHKRLLVLKFYHHRLLCRDQKAHEAVCFKISSFSVIV